MTDKILIDRAVVEQALRVLHGCLEHPDTDDAITALRAALEASHHNPAPSEIETQINAALGLDQSTQQPAVPPDKGPWQVDEWSKDRVVLQSHDFTHDVALIVTGDFESKEQKRQYAEAMAAKLNAAPAQVQDSKRSICTQCRNADSWGLPDKPVCRRCTSGSEWTPLNSSSVNPNKQPTTPAAQKEQQ